MCRVGSAPHSVSTAAICTVLQARAFAEADSRGSLESYAKAVAQAINEGGEPVKQVRNCQFLAVLAVLAEVAVVAQSH